MLGWMNLIRLAQLHEGMQQGMSMGNNAAGQQESPGQTGPQATADTSLSQSNPAGAQALSNALSSPTGKGAVGLAGMGLKALGLNPLATVLTPMVESAKIALEQEGHAPQLSIGPNGTKGSPSLAGRGLNTPAIRGDENNTPGVPGVPGIPGITDPNTVDVNDGQTAGGNSATGPGPGSSPGGTAADGVMHEGGKVQDRSSQPGGNEPITAQEGEYVVNRAATAMFQPVLEAINKMPVAVQPRRMPRQPVARNIPLMMRLQGVVQ